MSIYTFGCRQATATISATQGHPAWPAIKRNSGNLLATSSKYKGCSNERGADRVQLILQWIHTGMPMSEQTE